MDDARKLHETLNRVIGRKVQVKSIWEIGSRDGQDGLRLKREFPEAEIHLFEPNPDTFPLVQKVANSVSGMSAYNLALGSVDGSAIFQKIDRTKTVTSWPDGNPGASSFFKASSDYKVESYVQIPVEVEVARASTMLKRGLQAPDLIWMDVQGFEGHVIDGFGSELSNVGTVYVELSLREMYEGQILLREFVQKMSNSFLWVDVQNIGNWQVDAIFVNRKFATVQMRLADLIYRTSLATRINYGISYDFSKASLRNAALSLIDRFFEKLERKRHPFLAKFARSILRALPKGLKAGRVGQLLRKTVNASSPGISLAEGGDLPHIDVAIPAVSKDLEVLNRAVRAVSHGTLNPVRSISVVAPKSQISLFKNIAADIILIAEEDLIPENLRDVLEELPEKRRGWVAQQLVKILFARNSAAAGTLILDADTVLLRPRVWLSSQGEQLLCVSTEFHLPYVEHFKRVFHEAGHVDGLSFVTHHQLMQSKVLRLMFPDDSSLERWVRQISDFNSGASEYHDYGTYLLRNFPKSTVLARWGNVSCESENSSEAISRTIDWASSKNPTAFSVSLHSYNRILDKSVTSE